jgi:S-adenosylmethionine hydrolase
MTPALSGIITLLTDFGTRDPFVGVMKGVLLGRCPAAKIVDLTHEVAAQQVPGGAFWLAKTYAWFPAGTLHLAVVDPGVGTDRAGLVASAGGHLFIAPDNGLLAPALARDPASQARRIDPELLGLSVPSRTFHGRDVFAPVAAEILAGRLEWDAVGPLQTELVPLPTTPVRRHGAEVRGTVVTVDHFGNLITNIEAEDLVGIDDPLVSLDTASCPLRGTYGEVPSGELLGLVGSFGTLEVACRDGNAERTTGSTRGARVVVRPRPKP